MSYASFITLLEDANREGRSLAECVQAREALEADTSVADVREKMLEALAVMREAVVEGSHPELRSRSGLTGGTASQVLLAADEGDDEGASTNILSPRFTQILGASIAVAELNASMGRIVAAPTAGAAGVLPGVLLTIAKDFEIDDESLVDALLVAGALGSCFAAHATLSGAAGGCQAEIGTAAAMTAGALVYLLGGSNVAVGHGAAFALQGQLGLVCDPVAGLVEVPCVARNATGAAVALAGAQLALAGAEFPIPFDEIVIAAASVGASLPPTLRETAQGGLARTPTALTMEQDLTLP